MRDTEKAWRDAKPGQAFLTRWGVDEEDEAPVVWVKADWDGHSAPEDFMVDTLEFTDLLYLIPIDIDWTKKVSN